MAPDDRDHLKLRRVDVEYLLRVLGGELFQPDAASELASLHHALARLLRPLEDARLDGESRRMLRTFLDACDERSTRRSGIDLVGRQAMPPRVRETLDWLLTGATEKEIAVALGISVHTVHQYVKAIYKRFRVTSRAQLLARVRSSA